MKKILFILLLLPTFVFGQASRNFTGPLEASDFGVLSSNSDNTTALINAVAKAVSLKRALHIKAGTYVCSTISSGGIINFPANTTTIPSYVHIYGDGDSTVLTCSQKSGNFFQILNSNYRGIEIDHIFFQNTHDTTVIGPCAIASQGIKPNYVKHLYVHDCRFEGWANTIVLKGNWYPYIFHNIFRHNKGHDEATTTTIPACDLRLIDDTTGDLNRFVSIIDNVGIAFDTAMSALITKTSIDNFVYGHASGLIITGNFTYGYGEESLAIQPQPNVLDSSTVLISGNEIDCIIPTGSLEMGTAFKKTTNYGIRCDAPNATISNNNIFHAHQAIMLLLTGAYNYVNRNWVAAGNHIWMDRDTASAPAYCVYAQGYSSSIRSKGAIIDRNYGYADSITLKSNFAAFTENWIDSGSIMNNYFYATRNTLSGFGMTGIGVSTDTGVSIGNNSIYGVGTLLNNSSSTYSAAPIITTSPVRWPAVPSSTDTTTYKPLVMDGSGNPAVFSYWPIVSGGSSPPFADNGSIVKNNSDNTKQIKFGLSGITTSTTRTLTIPNTDLTIAGIDVGQTWTGSPVFTVGMSSAYLSSILATTTISVGAAVPATGGTTGTVNSGGIMAGRFSVTSGTGVGSGSTICTITLGAAQSSSSYKIFLQSTDTNIPIVVVPSPTSSTTFDVVLKSGQTFPVSSTLSWNYFIVQ